MTTLIRLFITTLAYCLLAVALTPAARAGTYTFSSCHFRDGRPAPTDRWRVVSPQAGARYDLSCADGSGLGVALTRDRTYPRGYLTGIGIQMPKDLTLTGAAVQDQQWSSGSTDWKFYSGYWGSLPGIPAWEAITVCGGNGGCTGAPKDWHEIWNAGFARQNFGLAVYCSALEIDPKPCPSTSVAATFATGVELRVDDPYPPTFRDILDGSLLDRQSNARLRTLRYSVADRGSGIRRVALQVDGAIVRQSNLEQSLATCAPPYGTPAPCPAEASGTFAIDTSAFSPGPHSGRLVVNDASDGPPLVYDFGFRAPGPPVSVASCASGEPLQVQLERNPVSYASRNIRFQLQGLSALEPSVIVMEERAGVFRAIGPATLDGHTYTAHFPNTASRTLRIAAPIDGGAAYACSDPVALSVRAGLRLTVTPTSVFNRQTIRFRGRLLGGPIAARRIVEIQARVRGSKRPWTLVRTVRTTRAGRFRMRYTFERTLRRARFAFRAVRKAGDAFPYASGTSNRCFVLVRGSRTF